MKTIPPRTDRSADSLLAEAADAFTDDLNAGRQPSIDDYAQEYPEIASVIRQVFPALAVLDGSRASSSAAASGAGDFTGLHRERLGDFRIERELGRGGMGIVYEAHELSLDRTVALKILPFASLLDEKQLARFKNEARAAATLNHPNIVPIYSVGSDRGVHYYAMQLIRGQSLAEVILECGGPSPLSLSNRANAARDAACAHKPPQACSNADAQESALANHSSSIENGSDDGSPHSKDTLALATFSTEYSTNPKRYFRRVAEIGIQIAEALDHAHASGVLHRDVKPANILLDHHGKAWITDFGLARTGADAGLTLTGDLVGTLRYMSPEQVQGRAAVVDHRSDVYSLGITLYELATLRPAFAGNDRHALARRIAEEDPRPAREHASQVPLDLETIVHKAIEKDPADRYASAAELAEDLARFSSERPIAARRPSRIARAAKSIKRHPLAAMATVAVLLMFLLGTSVAGVLVNRERSRTAEQRDEAIANLQLAMTALDEVYGELGRVWIASDRNLSDTQSSFLRRSATMLTEIAGRFGSGRQFRAVAGAAHLHAARANARLLNFTQAEQGYQRARELLAAELAENPGDSEVRELLAEAERRCGITYMARWQLERAEEAFQSALDHYERLRTEKRDDRYQRLTFLTRSDLLELAALDLRDTEVIREGNELRADLERLLHVSPDDIGLRQLDLITAIQVSESLRRAGRIAEATSLCEAALEGSAFPLQDSHDHRDIARATAASIAELGRCQLASGDVEKAEQNLRDALSRLQATFLFDGTPKQYSFAYMAHKVPHDVMEPRAFAMYARIQASLADALRETDRMDEAYVQADEAVRTCLTLINLSQELPQYVADAVECSQALARLGPLQDTDRQEAQQQLLTQILQRMRDLEHSHDVPRRHLTAFAELSALANELVPALTR